MWGGQSEKTERVAHVLYLFPLELVREVRQSTLRLSVCDSPMEDMGNAYSEVLCFPLPVRGCHFRVLPSNSVS